MDVVKIGRTIAFLRKQAGMTQAELAQRLYVTDKAVSRWERGVGTPDISLLPKLSAVLDTDIEAVLEGNFASKDADCKGLLIMNYPHNITASTFLYTKRVVYFQLSFFLLAGIRDVVIVCGASDDLIEFYGAYEDEAGGAFDAQPFHGAGRRRDLNPIKTG